jgi:hypothetical protein
MSSLERVSPLKERESRPAGTERLSRLQQSNNTSRHSIGVLRAQILRDRTGCTPERAALFAPMVWGAP